jgi:hypothetical protein
VSSVHWLAPSGITVAGKTPRPLRHALASTLTSASYLGWRSKRLVTRQNMAMVLDLPATHTRVRRVIDRPVASHGVEVTFFGHKTFVPAGAATMAIKSGAAIMPGYVWYAPSNRYYIRAFPPIFPRPMTTNEETARERQRLTQYMFACQEEVVRQCPSQWFMFRRFWATDAEPAGTRPATPKPAEGIAA